MSHTVCLDLPRTRGSQPPCSSFPLTHCETQSDDFFCVPGQVSQWSGGDIDSFNKHLSYIPDVSCSESLGSILYPWGSQPGDKASRLYPLWTGLREQ